MNYYAGIDVSLEASHWCVVDAEGQVVHEGRAASEPEAIARQLGRLGLPLARVGLEAGPLSQWLHDGLAAARLPVVLIETRHFKAAQAAMRVKTDRGDARAIAQVLRTGWFRQVHVKSLAARQVRALLQARQELMAKARDLESSIRGLLRGFGRKVGRVGRGGFAVRVRALLEGETVLAAAIEPLLRARAVLREQGAGLHQQVLRVARADAVCRQLMTAPGVGAVVALTFKAAIDDPTRFARSRQVGAHLGLTPKRYQSGQIDRAGRISKGGDPMVRAMLFEAATVLLLRVSRWSALKAWATRLAKRCGLKKARVALARKLAVVLHRMWRDGSAFRWSQQLGAAA
jgi:transposase